MVERTVVFCFDGLDFAYLDRYRDATPNVSALRANGIEAPLRSTVPPWTGCAWPSAYTGVDPGTHGVYGFFTYDGYPDTAEIVTRNDVRAPALWNYLSTRNRRSIVINVPVTYPAEPLEGVLLPGYLSPEDAQGYPPGIRDELAEALGEPYRIYAEEELAESGQRKLDGYCDLIRHRGRAAVHLIENHEWDLALVQLQKTDAVFHSFDDDEAFERAYAAADEVVGTVLEAVDGRPNVVLCSDHGIGPATGYSIHVNEILREAGMIETTDEDTAPSMGEHKSVLLGFDEGSNGTGRAARFVSLATSALRRIGIEPTDVYAGAERLGVAETLLDVLPEDAQRSAVRGVDWERSAAYCRIGSEMGVRLNVEGREPAGVVPDSEYESVRSAVIDLLSSATTPDGEPAFEFVCPREEVYAGPYVEDACDVVFLPRGMDHVVSPTLIGQTFVPIEEYTHKRDGVFVATGPAFASPTDDHARTDDHATEAQHPFSDRERLSLTDLAPIVMATLCCPVPERMEGSVPDGLLVDPAKSAAYEDVEFGTGTERRSPGEGVERHLEDLGYI